MGAMVNSTLVVKGILGSWKSTVVSMEPRTMPDPRPAVANQRLGLQNKHLLCFGLFIGGTHVKGVSGRSRRHYELSEMSHSEMSMSEHVTSYGERDFEGVLLMDCPGG